MHCPLFLGAYVSTLTHGKLLDWLIPAFLSAILAILGWMAVSLQDINRSLAVAVTKIDDHERRLQLLEGWVQQR